MTASDELFTIIKSLTSHEKRYFKIWASKHVIGKSNHYEKLFDAIDVLPDDEPYDEKAFKKTLRGKSYGKHLSDEKAHLSEILLKAMRVYHAERTIEGRLSEMLQEIRFLYSKGLMDICRDHIEQAYELADTHEFLEVKLQLIYLMRLTDKSAYDEKRAKSQELWTEREKVTIELIRKEREVQALREEVFQIYFSRQMDNKKEDVDLIYDRIAKIKEQKPNSFQTAQSILNTQIVIYESRKNVMEAVKLNGDYIRMWEESPWRIEEYPDKFKTLVMNSLSMLIRADIIELMPPLLDKLKSIKTTDPWIKANILVQYWQFSILYFLNIKKHKEALALLPELRSGMAKYTKTIRFKDKVNLYSNISVVYFLNKEYQSVLPVIKEIYQIIGRRTDYSYVIRDARYQEFIALYELGKRDDLDNFIRNAMRFFRENEIANSYTDLLWSELKKLMQCEYGKDKKARQNIKIWADTVACPYDCQIIHELVSAWL